MSHFAFHDTITSSCITTSFPSGICSPGACSPASWGDRSWELVCSPQGAVSFNFKQCAKKKLSSRLKQEQQSWPGPAGVSADKPRQGDAISHLSASHLPSKLACCQRPHCRCHLQPEPACPTAPALIGAPLRRRRQRQQLQHQQRPGAGATPAGLPRPQHDRRCAARQRSAAAATGGGS